MVTGRLRSGTFRRIFKKLPGSRVTILYKKRKPSKPKCSGCGTILMGVLRERPYKMRTLPKTKKRPSRPYGGVLCSKCTRELIKNKIRSQK